MPEQPVYRPEFIAALRLLAEAFEEVVKAGYPRPVLVGGAVVEFYTGGNVVSGDFDVLTDALRELEDALVARGFERPQGIGVLLKGVFHRELRMAVEVVSGDLFDGVSDKSRVRLVSLTEVGEGVAIPPVEDMIADRLGQFCANRAAHGEMLEQAVILYQIATQALESPLDQDYLDERIRQETVGDFTLEMLIEKANGPDHT